MASIENLFICCTGKEPAIVHRTRQLARAAQIEPKNLLEHTLKDTLTVKTSGIFFVLNTPSKTKTLDLHPKARRRNIRDHFI